MHCMALWRKTADRLRGGTAAVIMFIVLLLSIGSAVWLVHARTVLPARQGREILLQMRRQGLSHYWQPQRITDIFVARDKTGRVIGKMETSRWASDGKFNGRTEMEFSGKRIVEGWALDDKLASGQYATDVIGDPSGPVRTVISLQGGTVSVAQEKLSGARRADAPAGDLYLPEGSLHLAARLVAAGGHRAAFRIIVDRTAIEAGSKVNFTDVSMVPLSRREVRVEYRVNWVPQSQIYRFDKNGDVEEISDPDGDFRFLRTRRLVDEPPAEAGGAAI